MTPVDFGVFIPQVGIGLDTLVERVQRAESVGFRSAWLMDHLWPPGAEEAPSLEAWTTATVLAERTSTLRLGHLVLCNQFRHPALLAKMAATLDVASGGRLELGLGWGSVRAEFAAFGIGDEPAATRSARLGETLEILALLFQGERVSYEGRFYRLKDAISRPTPVQDPLPIHIGGAGPKLTMPLVARHAHWWNCVSTGVDRLSELRPLAGSARVSIQHPVALLDPGVALEETRARAERRFAGWGGVVIGTPEEVAARFAEEARLGVELFICVFADGGKPATLERFMREVAPAVRAG